ncbi:hypothetical protein [Thalassotalea marina]|uniref:Uncharacterized protein n=1 Tax=Thalassotalea marina TaxID=1673741 RepID=A0A919BSZ2_9GAMM|nr:hypothetical protein [Thalassotalea marina]GHG07776.1 hypothetical protein GCM10017161_41880 [Thalassotalea marina]
MTGRNKTLFQQIVNSKGWTFDDVGERWNVGERQMSRIAKSASQRDLDAANGLPNRLEANMSELANYLGITDEQLEELDLEIQGDYGSSGEMLYSYYFEVPEHAPSDVLEITGWKVGQVINSIPLSVFPEEPDLD